MLIKFRENFNKIFGLVLRKLWGNIEVIFDYTNFLDYDEKKNLKLYRTRRKFYEKFEKIKKIFLTILEKKKRRRNPNEIFKKRTKILKQY